MRRLQHKGLRKPHRVRAVVQAARIAGPRSGRRPPGRSQQPAPKWHIVPRRHIWIMHIIMCVCVCGFFFNTLHGLFAQAARLRGGPRSAPREGGGRRVHNVPPERRAITPASHPLVFGSDPHLDYTHRDRCRWVYKPPAATRRWVWFNTENNTKWRWGG